MTRAGVSPSARAWKASRVWIRVQASKSPSPSASLPAVPGLQGGPGVSPADVLGILGGRSAAVVEARVARAHDHVGAAVGDHLVGDGRVVVAADVVGNEARRRGMGELHRRDDAGGFALGLSRLHDMSLRNPVRIHADVAVPGLDPGGHGGGGRSRVGGARRLHVVEHRPGEVRVVAEAASSCRSAARPRRCSSRPGAGSPRTTDPRARRTCSSWLRRSGSAPSRR